MERHEFLRHLHRLVAPRNYLEIGVQKGQSLSLSRVPSIGVDPEFAINRALRCDLHLVRATSDDFFAQRDPIRHLRSGRNPLRNLSRGRPMFDYYRGGTRLGLVFVDGALWQAHSADDSELVPGEEVQVEAVDGLQLTVRR